MASKGAFAGVFPERDKVRSTDTTDAREKRDGLPNVPGEMFTSAEDHATVAIASALKRFSGSGSVAFVDASSRARACSEDGWVVGGSDEGSHGSVRGGFLCRVDGGAGVFSLEARRSRCCF